MKIMKRKNIKKVFVLCCLYNLIRKIFYYKDLVKNEFIANNDNIKDYTFHLFLIHNNKPVEHLDEEITNVIKDLVKLKLISYQNFQLLLYIFHQMSILLIINY